METGGSKVVEKDDQFNPPAGSYGGRKRFEKIEKDY